MTTKSFIFSKRSTAMLTSLMIIDVFEIHIFHFSERGLIFYIKIYRFARKYNIIFFHTVDLQIFFSVFFFPNYNRTVLFCSQVKTSCGVPQRPHHINSHETPVNPEEYRPNCTTGPQHSSNNNNNNKEYNMHNAGVLLSQLEGLLKTSRATRNVSFVHEHTAQVDCIP